MRRRVAALALAGCAAAFGVGACGDDGDGGAEQSARGTPVTSEQALALAQILQANRQHGGADFTADLQVQGSPVRATGRVDFTSGRGTMLVKPEDAQQGPPRRYFWTRRAVLAQSAPGAKRYTREAPDPGNDPVHTAIRFVNLLAAETIDNTANIRDQGARFVGAEEIDGTPVDVYRYGEGGGTTLWVGREDGLLYRTRSTRVPGGITVTLTRHEPVRVELPR